MRARVVFPDGVPTLRYWLWFQIEQFLSSDCTKWDTFVVDYSLRQPTKLSVCAHYVPDILPDSEDSIQNHALLSRE